MADNAAIELSIVMPCLNERDSIGECVDQAFAVIKASGIAGEVVVADNGSTDGSQALAQERGATVVHQPLRGYGNAYLKGFETARGRYILMADSDGTYDLSVAPRFVELLKSGYDVVMGSRVRGHIERGAMPFTHQYIGVPILTWFVNVVCGSRVSDAHCGMRAFSRRALEAMYLRTGGMEFASEMIIRAARAGLRISEVPITYRARTGSSKLRTVPDGWRHLRFILLYSPTYLFLGPGVAMLGLGLLILLALVWGPVTVAGLFFDFHYMVVGTLLALLGVQVVSLGLSARVYAVTHGMVQEDGVLRALAAHFRLETGLLLGMSILTPGMAILLWILFRWVTEGFGLSEGILIRPALLGMTLVAAGVQVLFASFFVSLLSIPHSEG